LSKAEFSEASLIVFDLDGVLIDSKDLHYAALNEALGKIGEEFLISPQEHATTYDGLSTNKKLEILHREKNLPRDSFEVIWKLKQEVTSRLLGEIPEDKELISFMRFLKEKGAFVALASNSIRATVDLMLKRLGVIDFFDLTLSNEDVVHPKPHPEIYWNCMSHFGVFPYQTSIFEDSHIGKQAAINSGANLIPIERRSDLDWHKIGLGLEKTRKRKMMSAPWQSEKLNVLIPMAGAGSRFEAAGYTFPKPLIEVNGKPMIQVVVENLNVQANFVFIVQKSHFEKFNLGYLLNLIAPGCKVVQIEGVTEGAACTTLLAREFIDTDAPLLIANSDQFVEWNSSETLYSFESQGLSGGIVTFEATHPKWSYAKLGEDGYVTEVAEKRPISNIATVGIYYWRKGSDYVKYADQMIAKNIRTNGEFYVCPVFNEAIGDGHKFRIRNIERMWGLGTPEDLNYFLENHNS
jgi:HAD superfamily hydrolase (TIGR01509 family)